MVANWSIDCAPTVAVYQFVERWSVGAKLPNEPNSDFQPPKPPEKPKKLGRMLPVLQEIPHKGHPNNPWSNRRANSVQPSGRASGAVPFTVTSRAAGGGTSSPLPAL